MFVGLAKSKKRHALLHHSADYIFWSIGINELICLLFRIYNIAEGPARGREQCRAHEQTIIYFIYIHYFMRVKHI